MDSRTRNVSVAGALLVLLSVGIVTVDASAQDSTAIPGTTDTTGTAAATTTSLVLTIAPNGGAARSVTLLCPGGGTHPDSQAACAALDAAGGDFTKVTPTTGQMCPHFVRPVTASASGTYQGRPDSWTQTFNNSCELDRATHPIFNF